LFDRGGAMNPRFWIVVAIIFAVLAVWTELTQWAG
jgi:hypothetical protein